MKCTRCGFEMENNNVCPGCGMVHAQAAPVNYASPVMPTTPQIPVEYQPISAWGYLGWNLLFSIPLVGFIMLIVFALGGTRNINLRNYARSYFCIFLLMIIIIAILALTGTAGLLFSGLAMEGYNGGY